jgi:hypothetical protein
MGLASAALGQNVVLSDGNSDAFFNVTGGNQVGWTVDGVNQLFNQRFYYRAAGFADEVAVDSLPLNGFQASDTNLFDDPRNDTLFTRHTDAAGIRFDIRYNLAGGTAGSGAADLGELITINNTGNTTQTISFFQYVDFDLGGTPGGDIGRIIGGRIADQIDALGTFSVNETVVTPAPSHYELNTFPNLVAKFSDGLVTDLTDVAGPLAGDVTWGFQWDFVLAPGDVFLISKDKRLEQVPAPAGVALVGLTGLVAMGRRRR